MNDIAIIVCVAFDHRASVEGLAKFKDCLLRCPSVETAMEVSGTFDLIVQGRCATLAEYTERMNAIRPMIAQFATRIETNFVSKRFDRSSEHEENGAIWLPCEGGHKRVDARLIDKVMAEGDYMRVHVGDWNCLVHRTMQRLSEQLSGSNFIKLHRSCLVRIGFIDRLVHDERRWIARLHDETHVSVAKSHIQQVLALMTGDSTANGGASPKKTYVNESSGPDTEMSAREAV